MGHILLTVFSILSTRNDQLLKSCFTLRWSQLIMRNKELWSDIWIQIGSTVRLKGQPWLEEGTVKKIMHSVKKGYFAFFDPLYKFL